MSYFCVNAKPQSEMRAQRWCAWAGFEAYIPMLQERERVRPLFPRYLFVREVGEWWRILTLPGVSGVLMADECPAAVGDEIINDLKDKEGVDGLIRLPKREPWARRARLRVRDPWHILAGHDLLFAGMRGNDRVRVMLSWFGREQSVVLRAEILEAVVI